MPLSQGPNSGTFPMLDFSKGQGCPSHRARTPLALLSQGGIPMNRDLSGGNWAAPLTGGGVFPFSPLRPLRLCGNFLVPYASRITHYGNVPMGVSVPVFWLSRFLVFSSASSVSLR